MWNGPAARALPLFFLFLALCVSDAAAPSLNAEGFYVEGGLQGGAVIIGRAVPLGGLKAGAGVELPLGSGELALGAETGFASTGHLTALPVALSAAYDLSLSQNFSLGAGLLLGGYLVSSNGIRPTPLFGGRLRSELNGPDRNAGVFLNAGMDISPEISGAALMPIVEIGLRLRPGQ